MAGHLLRCTNFLSKSRCKLPRRRPLPATRARSATCSVPASSASANKEWARAADTSLARNKSERFDRNRLSRGTCASSCGRPRFDSIGFAISCRKWLHLGLVLTERIVNECKHLLMIISLHCTGADTSNTNMCRLLMEGVSIDVARKYL